MTLSPCRTLQNVIHTQKCMPCREYAKPNRCVFKCFAKVSKPKKEDLKPKGKAFQLLGPVTAKDLKPQSVRWLGTTMSLQGIEEDVRWILSVQAVHPEAYLRSMSATAIESSGLQWINIVEAQSRINLDEWTIILCENYNPTFTFLRKFRYSALYRNRFRGNSCSWTFGYDMGVQVSYIHAKNCLIFVNIDLNIEKNMSILT